MFDQFQNPFESLGTAYQQEKYFTQNGYYIKPEEIPFAHAYLPRYNLTSGHVDQIHKHITFQYILVKKLVKKILESRGFMKAVLQHQASENGVMRDFNDGEYCRNHVFFSNPRNIALLYVDECEIANALGSKAGMHKIGVLYFTILNLPPQFRSSLSNCYLVGLYNAGDVKNYGFDPILHPLVNDIKEYWKGKVSISAPMCFRVRFMLELLNLLGIIWV